MRCAFESRHRSSRYMPASGTVTQPLETASRCSPCPLYVLGPCLLERLSVSRFSCPLLPWRTFVFSVSLPCRCRRKHT